MNLKIVYRFHLAALMAALVFATGAQARSLTVTAAEQDQLGIEVQTLASATAGAVGQLTLRVTFSMDGQRVIKTPLPGIVDRLYVQEGDRVNAGDPLLALRSSDLVDLQRDFLEASAAEGLHEAAWDRDRKLREAGSISERRWQESRFAFERARAAAAGLRGQLLVAGMAPADIDQLKATANISPELILRAPMSAVVLEREATLGDRVDGAGYLLRLGEPEKLVLEGTLSSSAAQGLQEGAEITQRGGHGRATVSWVSGVIDPMSQTVRVRAEPQGSAGLTPGQLTRWDVLAGDNVLLLPAGAVVRLEGEEVAFVATDTGFEVRVVQVARAGSGWRILDGLSDGERVAISGTAVLKGMALGMGGGD